MKIFGQKFKFNFGCKKQGGSNSPISNDDLNFFKVD